VRRAVIALGVGFCLQPASWVLPKFGISKGRVTLLRLRPSETPRVGETVAVEVTSRSQGVSDAQLSCVRGRLDEAPPSGNHKDTTGRERTATLEVIGGDAPGGWSSWTSELTTLRPRPARIKDVRITAGGGTVRVNAGAMNAQ